MFGLGGVGLNVVQGAKLARAGRIIGVDLSADKLALGRQFGCTDVISAGEVDDIAEAIADINGAGVDFAFEAAGAPAAVRGAMSAAHHLSGTVILLGMSAPDAEVSFDPAEFLVGLTIRGAPYGGGRARRDVPRFVDWYLAGDLNIDDLITSRMPLSEINTAADLMRSGQGIRSVVLHDHS